MVTNKALMTAFVFFFAAAFFAVPDLAVAQNDRACGQLGVNCANSLPANVRSAPVSPKEEKHIPWNYRANSCKSEDHECLQYAMAFSCLTEGSKCYDFKAVSDACKLSSYATYPFKPASEGFYRGDGYKGVVEHEFLFGDPDKPRPNWNNLPPRSQRCVLGFVQENYVAKRFSEVNRLAVKFREQWTLGTAKGRLTDAVDSLRERLTNSPLTEKTLTAWYIGSNNEADRFTYAKSHLLSELLSEIDNKTPSGGLSHHDDCFVNGKKCCEESTTKFLAESFAYHRDTAKFLDSNYITRLNDTVKNMVVQDCALSGSVLLRHAIKPGAEFRIIEGGMARNSRTNKVEPITKAEADKIERLKDAYAGVSTVISYADNFELLEKLPGGKFLGVATTVVEIALLPFEIAEIAKQANAGTLQPTSVKDMFFNLGSPVAAVKELVKVEMAVAVLWNKCNNLLLNCWESPTDCRCFQLCTRGGCGTKRPSWLDCNALANGFCD